LCDATNRTIPIPEVVNELSQSRFSARSPFERLDTIHTNARDREIAKDYLHKSDAFVEFAFGAWSRMGEIAPATRRSAEIEHRYAVRRKRQRFYLVIRLFRVTRHGG